VLNKNAKMNSHLQLKYNCVTNAVGFSYRYLYVKPIIRIVFVNTRWENQSS